MVLISDDTPRGHVTRFTPLRVKGMLVLDSRGVFGLLENTLAYEDVIPDSFLNPASAVDVLDLLLSLPIHSQDRVSIFIAWSKDVGYSFTRGDLDSLRPI